MNGEADGSMRRGWVHDHVVLVTGGASGLGRALVDRLLEEGANVAVLDKSRTKLDALAREVGDRIVVVEGDVTRLADNARAVREATARFGRLDALICNAGIFDYSVPLVDLPDDRIDAAFDEIFGVNVKGYVLGAKAALPELVRARGSLILTLSAAITETSVGGALYTASKHAGVGLVRQLAYEFAPHVRVNGVAPGASRTDLRGPRALGLEERSVAQALPPPEVARDFLPLERFAEAREQTGPYLLLASREHGAMITGTIVQVDGGAGIGGVVTAAGGGDLAERYGRP